MANKKGQEEMVGFALVVIIVAIVGLLLLGLSIRSGGSNSADSDNYQIRQFLDSSMHVTSDCTLRNNIDYGLVSDLVRECYQSSGKECLNSGETVCSNLNSTLNGIIAKGLMIGPDRPNKGYNLNISFEGKINEEILSTQSGECAGDLTAGEYLIPQDRESGIIVVRLTLCE